MNIKSLGDITNNPARASSLIRGTVSYQREKYQRDLTDKVNVASDQAVMVPSGSSGLIVEVDGAGF
jgi:hypothetical protein